MSVTLATNDKAAAGMGWLFWLMCVGGIIQLAVPTVFVFLLGSLPRDNVRWVPNRSRGSRLGRRLRKGKRKNLIIIRAALVPMVPSWGGGLTKIKARLAPFLVWRYGPGKGSDAAVASAGP